MANTLYFIGSTGSNWSDGNQWSTTIDNSSGPAGIHPGAGDTAYFSQYSNACAVNVNSACAVLDFTQSTGYSSTITFSAFLDVTGNITLSSVTGVSYGGTSQLRVAGSSSAQTLQSNGVTFGATLAIVGSASPTIASDWTVYGLYFGTGTLYTINDSTANTHIIYVTNVLTGASTSSGIKSTSNIKKIVLGNTSANFTWDYAIIDVSMDIIVNSGVTCTIGGTADVGYGNGTLTCTNSGTVSCSHSLTLTSGAIDTSQMTWADVSTANSSGTITLSSDLNIGGNFYPGGNTNTITVNGSSYNIKVTGNISVGNNITSGNGGGIKGTATILLGPTSPWGGTWYAGGTGEVIQNNMTVYTVQSRAFLASSPVYYSTGKLTMYES